jgi:hypothetical protein
MMLKALGFRLFGQNEGGAHFIAPGKYGGL